MTMTTTHETTMAAELPTDPYGDRPTGSYDPSNWITEYVPAETVEERLHGNLAALAVWASMHPLVDGRPLSRRFAQLVPETPLLEIPRSVLPPDLQDTKHRMFFIPDGKKPTGSYKGQGVINSLLPIAMKYENVPPEERPKVVAASTGNFAANVALGSTLLGFRSIVYMPDGAEQTKVDNTTKFGAEVRFASSLDDSLLQAELHGAQPGALFVHPFDQPSVIAGHGADTFRLPHQLADHGIDTRTTPTVQFFGAGGGGLASGNVVAGKLFLPHGSVHIAQAEGANALVAEYEGREFDQSRFNATVDGAAVRRAGVYARQTLCATGLVDGAHTIPHSRIGEAMAVTARFTNLYESAGVLGLSALFAYARQHRKGSENLIAHGSGINTSPEKVQRFATAAREAGLLTTKQEFELISAANLGRRPYNELEELGLALVAARSTAHTRRGSRVASGRW